MRVCLLDCDYVVDGNKPVIRIFCVTQDGKSFLGLFRGFKPYFYARPGTQDATKEIEKLGGVECCDIVEKELNGALQSFIKITCFLPSEVPQIREAVKSLQSVSEIFEYDILFYRRFMIDNSIYPLDWLEVNGEEFTSKFSRSMDIRSLEKADGPYPEPKTLAFDTETFEENGENKVIMLSVFANGLKKVITYRKCDGAEVVADEKALLSRFVEIIRENDPDVIVTYNGDGFDFPVLRLRFEKLKVPFILSRDGTRVSFDKRAMESSARVAGRIHIDLYRFVSVVLASQMKSESLTLDAVSNELLGEKKMGMKYEDIRNAWITGERINELCNYCLHDSYLTFSLSGLLLPQTFEIARIAGQPPFDTSRMTYGQLVEWFLMRKAYPKMMVPNRPKYGDIEERRGLRYEGGFVREPIPGLHEKISVMDFKSLYPSLIVSYNIDPATLNCSCCDSERIPGFDRWFCTKKTGFIPGVIKELVEKRTELKKKLKDAKSPSEKTSINNRQYALKIIANSIYGYYGYAGARWYSRDCAESATALGRSWVQRAMGEAEKAGFTVVYGDTDSLMIKGDMPERFLEKVNKELPGIMELN
ncbi:MAG: ribonuclease H-like domain-containing protein, partial [Candidatus Aenigmarchaeota archaeon]|nr:ribonuclease H-like domain-containing protein [Candidatus Aenigmarchaeota archaeon]